MTRKVMQNAIAILAFANIVCVTASMGAFATGFYLAGVCSFTAAALIFVCMTIVNTYI